MDPTFFRYASAITEQKKYWEGHLLAHTFDRFQTLRNNSKQHAATYNNIQHCLHTDATCNIQQCWELKWRNDRRSERNLCNCVKKTGKKNQDFNEVWIRDLAITRAMLYQLSYEAIDVGNRSIVGWELLASNVPSVCTGLNVLVTEDVSLSCFVFMSQERAQTRERRA